VLKTFFKYKIYLVLLTESFFMAWQSLVVNKLRTFLSLLGVTIGIFCIVSVLTLVDSLERNIQQSINELGSDVVFIQKWPWTFGGEYPWWKYFKRPVPQINEYRFLKEKSRYALSVAFSANGNFTVKRGSAVADNVSVTGVTYDYGEMFPVEFYFGRYFTKNEIESGAPVAIIGWKIYQGLFPDQNNAIGKKIMIGANKYTVIAVIKEYGESALDFVNKDNSIVIPLKSLAKLIKVDNDNADPVIIAKAKSGITNEKLKSELRYLLRSYRKLRPAEDDDFAINETTMLSQGFEGLFRVVNIAGVIIGGFAIIVGAFGIANIMFVSVKERTGQIGIQKALGAKNAFILVQFLFESVILCLFGGLSGMALIFLMVIFINAFSDFSVMLHANIFLLGVFISVLTGVLSGYFPARSAAALNPIDAIRQNF
jgi:putative ABC transport system permease protein